ncbi:MAG: S8 family serine peptidase [Pseudomonadota bacterium]|nr:S8 family serine peptidase [Pseudomonadota bacterium]
MSDVFPPISPTLPRFIRAFFDTLALPDAQGGLGMRREELANLSVFAASYVRYPTTAPAVPVFGASLRPRYGIRLSTQPLRWEGAGPVVEGQRLDAGHGAWQDLHFLMELGDAATDSQATLERLLARVDRGAEWARAIATAPDRAAFAVPVASIAAAPPGSPDADVGAFQLLLKRHFTYDDNGAYFAKYEGGTTFPTHASAGYRARAIREIQLYADERYVYGVVPERTVRPDAPPEQMREFLVHLVQEEADDPITLREVYSAPRGNAVVPFHQFCFFQASDGRGVAMPVSAREALTPSLAGFVGGIPDEDVNGYLARYGVETAPGGAPTIRVTAAFLAGSPLAGLPPGVELEDDPAEEPAPRGSSPIAPSDAAEDPTGTITRFLRAPVDQLVSLAARDDVHQLAATQSVPPNLDLVPVTVNRAAFVTSIAPAGNGGTGVFLGLVDTGIDGAHPAFTGRIHAVWDQVVPTQSPPPHPGMNFGRVLRGADIATHSVDRAGHGTHVIAIAGGRADPANNYPYGGIAPDATICAVRAGDTGFSDRNIVQGVRWLFREAGDRPCVVNLSIGGHFDDTGFPHGHDGGSSLSTRLRDLVRLVEAGQPAGWRRGRIIVAAAGNERGSRMHAHVARIEPDTNGTLEVDVRAVNPAMLQQFNPFDDARIALYVHPLTGDVNSAANARVAIRVERSGGAGGTDWLRPRSSHAGRLMLGTNAAPIVTLSNGPALHGGRRAARHVTLHGRPPTATNPAGTPITAGRWRIHVQNLGTAPIEVHGYIGYLAPDAGGVVQNVIHFCPVYFAAPTYRCMIGSPGDAQGLLVVGSESNHEHWTDNATPPVVHDNMRRGLDANNLPQPGPGALIATGDISPYSNPGPIREKNRSLSTVAPGGVIISARSATATADAAGGFGMFRAGDLISATAGQASGTSMATPVIAGLIACMLEKEPDLDYPTLRTRLIESHRAFPASAAGDPDQRTADWGPGPVDAAHLFRP